MGSAVPSCLVSDHLHRAEDVTTRSGHDIHPGETLCPYNLPSHHLALSGRLWSTQVLFLDNLDSMPIDDQKRLLGFVFDYLPDSVCAVTACNRPVRPLITYQNINQVVEITKQDVTYTLEECRELVEANVSELVDAAVVDELLRLSRGWPLGLQLLVDDLGHNGVGDDGDRFLNLVDEGSLADSFFSSLILDNEPCELEPFLVDTSICNRMSADLCNRIRGIADSQDILERLCADNLFTESDKTRKGWYTYHPLFRLWLRSKLLGRGLDHVRECADRAGDWFEKNGAYAEAAKFVLIGSDTDFIENLAAEIGFVRGNLDESFVSWAIKLSAEDILGSQLPCLYAILAYYLAGDARSVRFWLDDFKTLDNGAETVELSDQDRLSTRQLTSLIDIKCDQYEGRDEEALAGLSSFFAIQETLALPVKCLAFHALGECYERVGRYGEAHANYLRSEAIAESAGSTFYRTFSRYSLGWLLAFQGELKQALETCADALAMYPPSYTLYGGLHSLMAFIQTSMGDYGEAEENIAIAIDRLSAVRNKDMLLEAQVVQAWLLVYTGDVDEAYRAIVKAAAPFDGMGLPRGVLLFAYHTRSLIAIKRSDLDDAHHSLSKLASSMGAADAFYVLVKQLTEADILQIEGYGASALPIFEEVAVRSKELGLGRLLLVSLIGETIGWNSSGEKSKAYSAGYEALRLGARQGDLLPFIAKGKELSPILHEIANLRSSGSTERAFAKVILARVGSDGHPASKPNGGIVLPSARLTQREKEVLGLLNSGMSRVEIAETLGVSLNTVKTHVTNVFAKLGVGNRADAFAVSQYLDD